MKPMHGFLILVLMTVIILPLKAQTDLRHIAVQISDEIVFYEVDESGNFEPLNELSDMFATIHDEWSILTPNTITLSPNNQKLAFVAHRLNAQRQQETTLFIYSFDQTNFQQISLPGIGDLFWSPDSDAIAIAPAKRPYPEFDVLDSIYIFDMNSAILAPIADSRGNILWLPDSIHLAYVKTHNECNSGTCLDVGNIFAVDRFTLDQSTLTDLRPIIPSTAQSPYNQCEPTELRWAQNDSRIYYALRCIDVDDKIHDNLYSISLNADNRLEGDFATLFNDDENTIIKDIHPNTTKQGVYVTLVSQVQEPIDSESTKPVYYWRVLHVTQAENIQTISQVKLNININLTDVAISPNEDKIVVSGMDDTEAATGYVLVVDLTTGQTEISNPTSLRVCQVAWLNDLKLLYSEYSDGFCGAPEKTWKLDIENNSAEVITDNLEGTIWVLPIADVAPAIS